MAELIVQDDFTLTAQDISNKYVTLTRTPVTSTEVALNIVEGGSQEYGVDYIVSGLQLIWNGYDLDGYLAENDQLRVVYSTENAINSFSQTPQRDGVRVTSTLNTERLLAMTSGDSYFDATNKFTRVDITYIHEDNRQKVTIVHNKVFQGRVGWSSFAQSGTWRKMAMRCRDTDGALLYLDREDIGTEEDLVLS